MNAPRCHTYLEIIYVRYGKWAHLVFLFFALVTNILVGSQLLLGGSAVVTALTGMNVYAAVFLIPTGVCTYVILGGLRATFLCDYSHGLVLMVIIMYFMFNVYTSNETIGSPSRMYDLLHEAAIKRPVAGNHEGSYLTLKSNFALIFGVIQLCSGSGTVFLDQVRLFAVGDAACLANPQIGILAESYRIASNDRSQSICHGRSCMVRYSLRIRHHPWSSRSCFGRSSSIPDLPGLAFRK
jgi:Na+(H+)/acetate symporter ActP